MTTPANNSGSPTDQSIPPAQPARNASPAVSLANTIDSARQHLPAVTSTPAPLQSLDVQREPSEPPSRIRAAVTAVLGHSTATQDTIAPEISEKPASEHIMALLNRSVSQKKNALPEPRWYYEYLARHLDEFQDRDTLQRLFNCLWLGAKEGYLPFPSRQESETLSKLICRLCNHAQNSKDFLLAFDHLIRLLSEFRENDDFAENEPILSPDAFYSLFAALKVLPSFKESSDFQLASLVSIMDRHSKLITTPEQLNCLALLLIASYQRHKLCLSGNIASIPGLSNSLLTQGVFYSLERLQFLHFCTYPGSIMPTSSREKLCTLLDEIAQSVGSCIAELEKKEPNDHAMLARSNIRTHIVPAIKFFRTIASHAQFAPLTPEEIAVLAKLLKHLSDISPTFEDVDIVLNSLSFFFQSCPRIDLKPLDDAILHLINAAVRNGDMRCVSRHSSSYRFLASSNRNDSILCANICKELLSWLKNVTSVSTDEEFVNSERIAKAFYIAGLLADFPLKIDCRKQVRSAFMTLASSIIPSQNFSFRFSFSSLDELIVTLLRHYASLPPDENRLSEEIFQLLSGLGMMACNQLFKSFPDSGPDSDNGQIYKGEAYDTLLDWFSIGIIEKQSNEEAVEILFWLGSMAEMREKAPGLNPFLDKHQFFCADLLLQNLPDPSGAMVGKMPHGLSAEMIAKLLSGLGKLVVYNRLRKLSLEGKNRLRALVMCYSSSLILDYSEFLFILSHLYMKGLIGGECKHLQASFYRPFLLRSLQEAPPHNIEQISKILFFIDAVQPLQTGKDSAAEDEKVKFASCVKEMKSQMAQYLTQIRLDGNKMFFPRKRQKN